MATNYTTSQVTQSQRNARARRRSFWGRVRKGRRYLQLITIR